MAQPIPLQIPSHDPRRELIEKLEQAPAEHAAALLDAYALIQALHEKRIFETLRGALSASEHIVETAVHAAESRESIFAIRNAIILSKMLGAINPELLQCVAIAVGQTLGSERKPVIEPPGLFALLKQFRQTELRRSIALINRFLDVLGDQLKKGGTPTQSS